MLGIQTAINAQVDSPIDASDTMLIVRVNADPRLDLLGKKLADYNVAKAKSSANGNKVVMGRTQGYRLMVVNSSDRTYAMSVRSYLLKQYAGQHMVHMTFVNPYIKLKFGDFIERSEALRMRDQLLKSGIINGNIYVVPEQVIVKKTDFETEEEN
jgi:hypothetical protein